MAPYLWGLAYKTCSSIVYSFLTYSESNKTALFIQLSMLYFGHCKQTFQAWFLHLIPYTDHSRNTPICRHIDRKHSSMIILHSPWQPIPKPWQGIIIRTGKSMGCAQTMNKNCIGGKSWFQIMRHLHQGLSWCESYTFKLNILQNRDSVVNSPLRVTHFSF